jgi:predicted transcriptional regulator
METQNITLALPKEILQKAKIMAVKRHTSLSGLLTQVLSEMVAQEEAYASNRRHHLAWLERGADLGTEGTISWQREDLHGR